MTRQPADDSAAVAAVFADLGKLGIPALADTAVRDRVAQAAVETVRWHDATAAPALCPRCADLEAALKLARKVANQAGLGADEGAP